MSKRQFKPTKRWYAKFWPVFFRESELPSPLDARAFMAVETFAESFYRMGNSADWSGMQIGLLFYYRGADGKGRNSEMRPSAMMG